MQHLDEIIEQLKGEESVDIKSFIFRLLSKWYWFALFGFLGVCFGFFHAKKSPAIYEMHSSILIKDDDAGMSMDNIFEGLNLGGKANVVNHIFMLKSFELNNEAVKNLQLDVSWYLKSMFVDVDMYGWFPYDVSLDKSAENIKGVDVNITATTNNSYLITVKGEYKKDGRKREIDFEKQGEFGKPFRSQYFNFTLTKNNYYEIPKDNEYYFRVNNMSDLTKSYINRLNISLVDEDGDAIVLSLKETVPQRGVDFLNALTTAYLKYGLDEKNRTSENTVRFIDDQIQGVIDSLKIAGHQFTEFRSKKGIVDLSEEGKLIIERLKNLQVEKELAQRKLEYFQSLQNYMTDADQMKNIAVPSVLGIEDAGLNSLVVKLGDLYSKRSSMLFVVKEENPAVQMLNNEIDNCLGSLGENIKNLLKNTKIELKNIELQLNEIEIRQANLPKTEQQLINIKRTFDLNNDLYTYLLQRRAEAEIATASNVPDANVLDKARIDVVEQIGPNRLMNLIIGLIIGLAIPFVVIVVFDYLDDSIKSREDLDKNCKLPIAAEIVTNKYDMEIPVVKYPRSGIAETFRRLRVNLQYLSDKKGPKVVAVHSVVPGEGKSFTALNLSSILALDNKKVLLVGCDLRKPRLHNVFNAENDKGLSSFLIDKFAYEDLVLSTEQKGLFYTNAGPIPPNPSELIGNGKMKKFVERAKQEFDYIILDNAPISLVIDGFLTGEYADINLIVMRQGYSSQKQIGYVNNLKEKEKFNNVAVVLNDTKSESYFSNYKQYANRKSAYFDDCIEKSSKWKRLFKRSA